MQFEDIKLVLGVRTANWHKTLAPIQMRFC